jgi:hypothetical protein
MLNASALSVNAATGLDTNDLKQALLVDFEHDVLDSRLLLLSSLNIAVHFVASYTEVFHLNDAIGFSLVVLNICPSDERASDIAAYVRRRWPRAKVLLLGTGCGCVEDHLYDNVFWEQFGAGAERIVLLRWLSQGVLEARRSLASDTETNLRQRKRAPSRGYLILVMALASVLCSVSVWDLWHNLCIYGASEKDPPTTLPAKLGSSKNHPLRDTQLRRVLPQEGPSAIFGGQRLSGFGPIILLTTINLPTHFKRARNEEIELGSSEVIYA